MEKWIDKIWSLPLQIKINLSIWIMIASAIFHATPWDVIAAGVIIVSVMAFLIWTLVLLDF